MNKEKKKSFDDIYEIIYQNSKSLLDIRKKDQNKKFFLAMAVGILCSVIAYMMRIEPIILLGIIAIILLLLLILYVYDSVQFKRIYKEYVIAEMVKLYSKNLNFLAQTGVTRQEYKMSGFDTIFTEFHSEDKIQGLIQENIKFQMSQIVTGEIEINKNADGSDSTTRRETFRGTYGMVTLPKNIKTTIHITYNSIMKKLTGNRIEVDSSEFEQYYDCFADNKIIAMQILTPDIIEKLVQIKQYNKGFLEFKIENQMLYFRHNCGEAFEPPKLKDALDKEVIRKYYDLFVIPIEIIEIIIENLQNIDE